METKHDILDPFVGMDSLISAMPQQLALIKERVKKLEMLLDKRTAECEQLKKDVKYLSRELDRCRYEDDSYPGF